MRLKHNRINKFRLVLQTSILAYLAYMVIYPFINRNYVADFEASCPFGGLQSLAGFLLKGNLACSMTTVQISLGIALIAVVVIFAKLFCSYVCPIGTLTEWIGSFGRKMKVNFILQGWSDRLLRSLKYILLFATVYFTLISSELFCKKFDPYYASFSGFSSDVNLWYAISAIALTVIGSFFIRQFWCKYLCPLSALTNIAIYLIPTLALVFVWVILTQILKLQISWIWLLGAVCLTGLVLEVTKLKYLVFPPIRISRNTDICTKCRICDKKCPMGIQVSSVDQVQHIDCHLCTDCVVNCPEKGALTISKRLPKWAPASASVILIIIAFIVADNFELPTISEYWGNKPEMSRAQIFEMSGLKNIKCFGSSMSFSNQVREVKGILGVETFVNKHRVKIFYDSTILTPSAVKEAIFTPYKMLLNSLPQKTKSIAQLNLGIDRCFDPNDQYYLSELLKQEKGVLAFQTQFGEPVKATIYYDSTKLSPKKIISEIEQPTVTITTGNLKTINKIDFKVNRESLSSSKTTNKKEFYEIFFEKQDVAFNKFSSYRQAHLDDYTFFFAGATDPLMQEWIPYLVSHLSNDDGIVRFRTEFNEDGALAMVTYVKTKTTVERIRKLLKEPVLSVYYPDGKTEKVKNPFSF